MNWSVDFIRFLPQLIGIDWIDHEQIEACVKGFQRVIQPAAVAGQRAIALRFADVAVQALLSVLLVFRLPPRGFSNRELRDHGAPLLGKTAQDITRGQMAYHLRRLRFHGLIERLAGTHRYRVTEPGWRTALFCTRCYYRLLRRCVPDWPRLSRSHRCRILPCVGISRNGVQQSTNGSRSAKCPLKTSSSAMPCGTTRPSTPPGCQSSSISRRGYGTISAFHVFHTQPASVK
jgi:hypothetical protein